MNGFIITGPEGATEYYPPGQAWSLNIQLGGEKPCVCTGTGVVIARYSTYEACASAINHAVCETDTVTDETAIIVLPDEAPSEFNMRMAEEAATQLLVRQL